MQYLMMQNEGIAPVEGYTVLGVSTTRTDKREGTSGQFGSGSKHAINLCLRNGISPIIFTGLLKMEFYTKPQTIDDGLVSTEFGIVHCKMSGKLPDGKTKNTDKDLGFVVEYGALDWPDLSKGLQELVKNAIDRTIRQNGDFQKSIKDDRLSIKVVEENQVRAKDGFTRVFIPLTSEVQRFFGELPRRFMHFGEPESLSQKVLFKKDRNLTRSQGAMIYHHGVFLLEVNVGNKSLFDYNFGNELTVDEARNTSDYSVSHLAANALRDANSDVLAEVFRALIQREKIWEMDFDSYYLRTQSWETESIKNQRNENWQKGWKKAAGDKILAGTTAHEMELVSKKGYNPIQIPSTSWTLAAETANIPSVLNIATSFEKDGHVIVDTHPNAIKAVEWAWNIAKKHNMLNGKTFPKIASFTKVMNAGSQILGFYSEGVIYIHTDLTGNVNSESENLSQQLLATATEELIHYLTGATDMSRDFQDFAINLFVKTATTQ